jgi:hypothetical protein
MSAPKSGAAKGTTRTVATPARASAKPRRQQTAGAAPSPRSRLARTAQAIGKQVSDNPLATLAGAAAVTAGIALLLPAGRREAEVLGEVADKIGEAARDAADNAVDAGRQQVTELAQAALNGLGGNVVESLIGSAGTATAGE